MTAYVVITFFQYQYCINTPQSYIELLTFNNIFYERLPKITECKFVIFQVSINVSPSDKQLRLNQNETT